MQVLELWLIVVRFNTTKYNEMMKGYQDFTDTIPETASY